MANNRSKGLIGRSAEFAKERQDLASKRTLAQGRLGGMLARHFDGRRRRRALRASVYDSAAEVGWEHRAVAEAGLTDLSQRHQQHTMEAEHHGHEAQDALRGRLSTDPAFRLAASGGDPIAAGRLAARVDEQVHQHRLEDVTAQLRTLAREQHMGAPTSKS